MTNDSLKRSLAICCWSNCKFRSSICCDNFSFSFRSSSASEFPPSCCFFTRFIASDADFFISLYLAASWKNIFWFYIVIYSRDRFKWPETLISVVPSKDMDHHTGWELPKLYLDHGRVLFTSLYCCSNWVIWSWSSDLTWLLSDNWEVNDSRSVVVFSFKASKVSTEIKLRLF